MINPLIFLTLLGALFIPQVAALKCIMYANFGTEPEPTCEAGSNGVCAAQFRLVSDGRVSVHLRCLTRDVLDDSNVCLRTNNGETSVWRCCDDRDFCNEDFMELQPFNITTTGPPTVSAVAVAVPIAILVPAVIILIVIITVVVIRCRKKHLEAVRRGNPVVDDIELSCDNKPYTLDDQTDLSGSGFGVPHLQQRTIARNIKLGELIGAGRFGQVLLGDYQGETVAVKKFLSIDGQSWQREIEVYTTNLLTHDGILRFIASDMISIDGSTELWLITQYHHNGSLYDYLNRKELTPKTLMSMSISICSGLMHLHTALYGTIKKAAIAHRDIKTRNILVKNDLCCCIADFGLAVTQNADSDINVPRNSRQGTKRYMPPEVLEDKINTREFRAFQLCDVYSLGLVLWEMARRCGGDQRVALDYEPPYHGLVPPDPSFEEMRRVVVFERRQPTIPANWRHDDLMKGLLQLMRDCWTYESDGRPNVAYIKKKLNKFSQEDKLDYEKTVE